MNIVILLSKFDKLDLAFTIYKEINSTKKASIISSIGLDVQFAPLCEKHEATKRLSNESTSDMPSPKRIKIQENEKIASRL